MRCVMCHLTDGRAFKYIQIYEYLNREKREITITTNIYKGMCDLYVIYSRFPKKKFPFFFLHSNIYSELIRFYPTLTLGKVKKKKSKARIGHMLISAILLRQIV